MKNNVLKNSIVCRKCKAVYELDPRLSSIADIPECPKCKRPFRDKNDESEPAEKPAKDFGDDADAAKCQPQESSSSRVR